MIANLEVQDFYMMVDDVLIREGITLTDVEKEFMLYSAKKLTGAIFWIKNHTLYELRHVLFSEVLIDPARAINLRSHITELMTSFWQMNLPEQDIPHLVKAVELVRSFGADNLLKMVNRDPEMVRRGIIEKYARKMAAQIATTGVYNAKTFQKVFNLPLDDFAMVLKRSAEIVGVANAASQQIVNQMNLPGR